MPFHGWIVVDIEVERWERGNQPQTRPSCSITLNIAPPQNWLEDIGGSGVVRNKLSTCTLADQKRLIVSGQDAAINGNIDQSNTSARL